MLKDAGIDVHTRKQVYLSDDECRPYCSEAGNVDVLLIEHVENDTVRRGAELFAEMAGDVYMSVSEWEV